MAIQSGEFVSIGLAAEASYGSLSAGVPDASGLTFTFPRAVASLRSMPAESPDEDEVQTRDGSYRHPPRPNAGWDAANSRRRTRMAGSFTIEGEYDPPTASTVTSHAAATLRLLLASFMAELADPAAASEGVAGSASANVLTATTSTLYRLGAIVGHTDGAVARWAQVTDTDGTAITISPNLDSAGLGASDVVRFHRTLYIPAAGQAPSIGSLAARFDGIGVRFYAVGCVVESLTLSETEGGLLRWSASIQSPYIYPDHASAEVAEPGATANMRAHRINAAVSVSSAAAPVTAPASLTAVDMEPDPGSVSLALTNAIGTAGLMSAGMPSRLVVVATDAALTMTLSDPLTTVANDMEGSVQRTWVLGWGPQISGSGLAVVIPRGHLTQSAQVREAPAGDVVKQPIAVRPGRPHAVDTSDEVGASPLLIGLGL